MNYLLSVEQAEAYLSHYYNYDRAFVVGSEKDATSSCKPLVDTIPDYI